MAVDAISGAVGEIVQVAALYPLDTIKVRPYPNRAVPYPVGPFPNDLRTACLPATHAQHGQHAS